MKILNEKVKTVLFDKDGTLIDFSSIWLPWVESTYNYLNNQETTNITLNELKYTFGVNPINEIDPGGPLAISSIEESKVVVAYLLYKKGIPWDEAIIHASKAVAFANKHQNQSTEIKSIDGVEHALIKLKSKKITLGVLTADNTERAKIHLNKVGLLYYFDFVIGGDQVKNGKPFPDLAYQARDQFGIQMKESIMVGDTNADMQLGKQANVHACVGIITSFKNNGEHLKDKDYIIYHYDELFH